MVTEVALDGSNDDEECADGDSEEDDDAMERDENDDISLDDVDQDSAGDRKQNAPMTTQMSSILMVLLR
jgi:hypothetical protein